MRRTAFTIIELLVVLAIIGILIAAASLSFSQAQRTGRDAQRISDILLIGKTIDSSAITQGGIYPYLLASAYHDPAEYRVHSAVSCMWEFNVDKSSAYPIDKSMFKGNIIPSDPRPNPGYAPALRCVYPEEDYIYENHYIELTRWPLNPTSLPPQQLISMAQLLQVNYLLDVALENPQPSDDGTLKSYTVPQLVDTTHSIYGSLSFGNPTTTRHRYYLAGPYCGTSCYR